MKSDTKTPHRLLLGATFFLVACIPYIAQAASIVIEKKSGGVVEGEILEESASHLIIKTKFGKQKVDRTDILKMREGKSVQEQYLDRRKSLKDTDARGLLKLGEWCESHKLWRPAYGCYTEAMQIAGAHYPDAVMRMGALAMQRKEYHVAVKLYSQLVDQLKHEDAWNALKNAEESLRAGRRKFWKRANEEFTAKHYENAIAAYLEVLSRIVYETPRLSGDVSRKQTEDAILNCREAFIKALKSAWAYSIETPIERLPARYRDAYGKLEAAAGMAAQSSNAAAQLDRIRQTVVMHGMLFPHAIRLDYGDGAVLRDDLPDLLISSKELPPAFRSSWERETAAARKQFLLAYGMELAATLHTPLVSTDRGGTRWTVRPLPENIRESSREATLRDLRVHPERYTGRWVALQGTLSANDSSAKYLHSLSLDNDTSNDVAVVAYAPPLQPVHQFLLSQMGDKTDYVKSLTTAYPYETLQSMLRSLPSNSEVVLYGRLRQRQDVLPLYVFEVWDIDAVEDPGALRLASCLKRPLRCELRDTPVKNVLEFVTMVSQAGIKFAGGKTPDLNITLIAKRQPVILILDKIAEECGVQWTREEADIVMKPKLSKEELVRQNQIRRLAIGLKK